MPNPIPKRRLAAHKHQQGRCYYCGLPMWLKDPEKFAKQYGLKPSTVRAFDVLLSTWSHSMKAGRTLPITSWPPV